MTIEQLTRCLRRLAACSLLALAVASAASANAAPYVSCPGGYIAPSLKECPDIPQNRGGERDPTPPGGGGGSGGVLSDLLDAVGLGGLGGLL